MSVPDSHLWLWEVWKGHHPENGTSEVVVEDPGSREERIINEPCRLVSRCCCMWGSVSFPHTQGSLTKSVSSLAPCLCLPHSPDRSSGAWRRKAGLWPRPCSALPAVLRALTGASGPPCPPHSRSCTNSCGVPSLPRGAWGKPVGGVVSGKGGRDLFSYTLCAFVSK